MYDCANIDHYFIYLNSILFYYQIATQIHIYVVKPKKVYFIRM